MFRREFLKVSATLPFVGLIPIKKEEKRGILPIGTRIYTKNLIWSKEDSNSIGKITSHLTWEKLIGIEPLIQHTNSCYRKDESVYGVKINNNFHTHLYRDEFEIDASETKHDYVWQMSENLDYFDKEDNLVGRVKGKFLYVYDNCGNIIGKTEFYHSYCTINEGADFIKKMRGA